MRVFNLPSAAYASANYLLSSTCQEVAGDTVSITGLQLGCTLRDASRGSFSLVPVPGTSPVIFNLSSYQRTDACEEPVAYALVVPDSYTCTRFVGFSSASGIGTYVRLFPVPSISFEVEAFSSTSACSGTPTRQVLRFGCNAGSTASFNLVPLRAPAPYSAPFRYNYTSYEGTQCRRLVGALSRYTAVADGTCAAGEFLGVVNVFNPVVPPPTSLRLRPFPTPTPPPSPLSAGAIAAGVVVALALGGVLICGVSVVVYAVKRGLVSLGPKAAAPPTTTYVTTTPWADPARAPHGGAHSVNAAPALPLPAPLPPPPPPPPFYILPPPPPQPAV